MIKILGISGSLRAASFNTALLHGIPLYDGDLEQRDGTPPAVRELKQRMLASHGLLMVTPEYNNGVPGVFKNAVDWLSRKTPDMPAVFADRPVAVIGASPGGFGTIMAQNNWLPVLRTLGARHWSGGRLMVSRAQSVFGPDGALQDETIRRQLAEFVHGFALFVAGGKGAGSAP